jgi:uncharacterized membrane protein
LIDHAIYSIIVIIIVLTQWVAMLLHLPRELITNIGRQIAKETKKTRHLMQLSVDNFRRIIAGRR